MKKFMQLFGIVALTSVLFSFKSIDDPKVIIIDIVDNIQSTTGQHITNEFKSELDAFKTNDQIQVLDWKDISKGLKDDQKKALLDSIQPEMIMTISFKNATENKVTAVVSKQNTSFDESVKAARELTDTLSSDQVKNEGVFHTDSNYVQDNLAPAVFVSVEAKNDEASNKEIVSKLTSFIEGVKTAEAQAVADEAQAVEVTTVQ